MLAFSVGQRSSTLGRRAATRTWKPWLRRRSSPPTDLAVTLGGETEVALWCSWLHEIGSREETEPASPRRRQPGSTTATRTMVLSRSGQTPSHSSSARAALRSARDPREDGSVERTRPRVGAFEGLRPVLCRRRAPAFLGGGGSQASPRAAVGSGACPSKRPRSDFPKAAPDGVVMSVRDRAADCPRYRGCSVGRGRGSAGRP